MSQRKEYLPNPDYWEQQVVRFSKTFIQRKDCYPLQLSTGRYICVKKQLTTTHIIDHIRSKHTLGAYALDTNSVARWLCLDADHDDDWLQLLQLAKVLHKDNIPVYLETSRRGGHLWLFTPPLSGTDIRRFGKTLLKQHGLPTRIELYPKQDQLKTGPGSLVRLPLGVHRKTGKRYPFIQLNGTLLAPTIREQVVVLSQPRRVPRPFIDHILAQFAETQPPPPSLQLTEVSPIDGKHLSERIKAVISVRDFVSRYVELNERNVGNCPFHDDQNPSFGVNDRENYWACWASCGGGSIIDFWSRWREKQGQDGSFTATITDLARILF